MLTKLRIRNFKRFDRVEVDLGNPVVLLGPNDSGKSTVMQALSLWERGLRQWLEKRSRSRGAPGRHGVPLNRQDLVWMPVPRANLLWKDLHLREVSRDDGWQATANVRIEIVVEGNSGGAAWKCGLEFDYANEELIYCRPLRTEDGPDPPRMPVPDQAAAVRTSFLPPISGIASTETLLAPGTVRVRVGEGRTAEVLRNLCLAVRDQRPRKWERVVGHIHALFGVEVDPPRYRPDRGEITMAYRDRDLHLDISSAGRGLHQVLLLLSFMYASPGSVLLLDEPDAHLEPLRQRQAYRTIREVAHESGSQIIIATHSEVILGEAADQDLAIAFVGKPHRIGRTHRERATVAVREIGLGHCLQAKQTGWVLYLGGPADLSALQAFASRLGHEDAIEALRRPFVHYVANSVPAVERHFQSLASVVPGVRGCLLLDGPAAGADDDSGPAGVTALRWRKGKIADYVHTRAALEAFARRDGRSHSAGPLFASDHADTRRRAMREAIDASEPMSEWRPGATRREDGSWVALDSVLRAYRGILGVEDSTPPPNAGDLVECLPDVEIDAEVREKLDAIASLGAGATRVAPT